MNDTFKALSNPIRREIIAALRAGPMASGDIARLFDMSWPTITGHLAVLKDAGLIEAERAGTSVRYRLVSGAFEDALAFLLDLAGAGRAGVQDQETGNIMKSVESSDGLLGKGVYALVAAQVGLAGYIALFGPQGPLLMHFDMHGNVDRWGGRLEAAGVLLGFAVLTLGLESMVKRVLARADVAAGTRKSLVAARVCTALGFAFVTALLAALGLGRVQPGADPLWIARWGLVLAWVGILVVGALLGKAGPNPWVGLRVYWTRRSRLAWERANRMLGHIYFLGSLAGLALLPVVDEAHGYALLLAVVLGGALAATIESWRVWRADPERQA